MHKELYIVKGIPNVSSTGQEAGAQPLSLINKDAFALKTDGWTPQIAQFQGTWKETNLVDGRELIAGKNQNVIENMQLILSAGTHSELYSRMAILNQMAENAQLFYTSNYQFEPVYLKWWAECGAGYQYALIYNIDVTPAFVDLNQTPTMDIALTIEREPYWRPIPPGIHPRVWTAYRQTGIMFDPDFDDYNLVNQSVNNFTSIPLNANTVGVDNCHKSYVDIDADDLVGDAPVLINIEFDGRYDNGAGQDAGVLTKVMVSRYSRPIEYVMPGTSPYQIVHTNTLQSNPDTSAVVPRVSYTTQLVTNAATAADTGARGRKATCAGASVKNRVDVSYGTATDALRVRWSVSPTVMAGTYVAYLRGGQRGGSFGDQSIYLSYGYGGGEAQTDPVNPELTDASPSEFWGMTYLGTVDIPTGKRRVETSVNFGLLASDNLSFTIDLYASRSTGSSTLYIQDLVLMPIDEPNIELDSGDFSNLFFTVGYYDNTGYSLHGEIGDVTYGAVTTPEMRGGDLMLKPGVKNRLYFLFYSYPFQGTVVKNRSSVVVDPNTANEIEVAVPVKINILPRWRSIRDV